MTPLGARLRQLRRDRNLSLKDMAAGLNVSSAYISALEHGKKGVPTWFLVQRIITFFNLIWDEAEEIEKLAQLSDPRVTIDTIGLSPEKTYLANLLAQSIRELNQKEVLELITFLEKGKMGKGR
jgi:transcriptional regulator with XRE-family HTH domain